MDRTATVTIAVYTYSTPNATRTKSWESVIENASVSEIIQCVKDEVEQFYQEEIDDTLITAVVEIINYENINVRQPHYTIYDRETNLLNYDIDEVELRNDIMELIADE